MVGHTHPQESTHEDNLERAIRLAQIGFRVFPYYPILNGKCTCNKECPSAGKHPRIRGYLDDAASDEEQVQNWWGKWPSAGIGICPDNQLILDIDGPQGHESLLKLQAYFGNSLPATFTCISGGNEPHHYHLYYRLPPNTRVFNKPLYKFRGLESFSRIDVRSQRGQVAAPGTMHRDGQRYKWDTNREYDSLGCPGKVSELPEAPEWLLLALGGLKEARDTGGSNRVKGKRREVPFCGQETTDLIPETDEWYVRVVLDRWPITQSGQRNCLQGKPITYLLGRRLSTDRVHRIMKEWLHSQTEYFITPIEQAILELQDSIARTAMKRDEGKIELVKAHDSLASSQTLHPVLQEFLETILSAHFFVSQKTHRHSNDLSVSLKKVEHQRGTSQIQNIKQFLEALLAHYQYRVTQFDEQKRIKMTHAQILNIIEGRFDGTMGRKKLYRLADMFITRSDPDGNVQSANVVELLRQIKQGHTGTPSEYEVTGIPSISDGRSENP